MDKGLCGLEIARSLALSPGGASGETHLIDTNATLTVYPGGASFGSIQLVAKTGLPTAVSFYTSPEGLYSSADLGELRDANGTLVTITVPATLPCFIELPSACLSVPYLHPYVDAGSITARLFLKG